jgi:hypothetical protein
MSTERKITRRHWLTTAAVFTATGGASLLPSSSSAQGKIGKAAARYRNYPKRMQMCGIVQVLHLRQRPERRNDGWWNDGWWNDGWWNDGWWNGTWNDGSGDVRSRGSAGFSRSRNDAVCT